jgi:hypothetical protein
MTVKINTHTAASAEILRLIGELVGSEDVQTRLSTVIADLATVDTELTDGTTGLANIKDLIDTLDTVADGIQTDLSNGTDGLGAIKILIDAVQADLDNGTDGLGSIKALVDTLTTNVATVDTVVDGIQTDLDNGTDGLGAIKATADAIETDTQDLQTKVGTPAGASVSADLAALKSVADNINNSTRVNASVPNLVEIPEAGTEYYRLTHNIFDSVGDPIDSTGDAVYFRAVSPSGTALSGAYFSDNVGTAITAASGLTGVKTAFNGWYAMDTTPTGRASSFLGIASTATQEGLTIEFGHELNSQAIIVSRATSAVNYLQAQGAAGASADAVWDELNSEHAGAGSTGKALSDILVDTSEVQTDLADGGRIDLILDELTAQGDTNEGTLSTLDTKIGTPINTDISSDIADVKTEVDKIGSPAGLDVSEDIAAIKTVVDTIGSPANLDIASDIADVQTKLGTPIDTDVTTDIAAVKTEVDKIGLPANSDVSTDIADVKTDISTVDTVVNGIQTDLDNATDGLGAIKTLVDNLQTSVNSITSEGTLFKAVKTTSALAQAASVTLDISDVDGFDCINAQISRLRIAVTGATTNYTIEIYEKTANAELLWSATDTAGDDVDNMFSNLHFLNQDTTPGKNIYVRITNNTDVGTSTFSVELRGEKKSDTLA